jgi:histidyl-tRNA synthetase
MAEILRAVKGMNDIFPASVPLKVDARVTSSNIWQWFEQTARSVLHRYGYQNLMTPMVEPTALFVRGIGEVTDIVEKEMYSFEDSLNGDKLTLRPEFTAGIVRAIIEHNALYNGPVRLWSMGPVFRHERWQKGRYRQFHQLDVEAMGFAGPDVDAEQILLTRTLLRELGLKEGEHIRLEINSLGQPAERAAHRAALVAYFEANAGLLDEDSQRRLKTNPLRILDSKNPVMQDMINAAPKLMDFLGEQTLAHFNGVRAVLDAVGLEYRINTRLVRGLDYYNLTVFEWITEQLGSQGTVCGGGRYDGLIEQLGGKPAPAVGWGLGIERLLLLLEAVGVVPPDQAPDLYFVVACDDYRVKAMALAERFRSIGASVILHASASSATASLKSQMKKADASGASVALIFGDYEIAGGTVSIKDLRNQTRPQYSEYFDKAGQWMNDVLMQARKPRNA